MEKLSELFQKYPWLILGLVAAVAYLAFRSSASDSGSGGLVTTGGGVQSLPVDQGTVAIETNRQNANAQNLSTIASLVLGEHQSSDSLTASLAQTGAQRDIALAQVTSELTQAQIAAATTAAMRANDNATSITRAQIDAHTSEVLGQFNKDIERAKDNTNIANGVIGVVKDVAHVLTLGFL